MLSTKRYTNCRSCSGGNPSTRSILRCFRKSFLLARKSSLFFSGKLVLAHKPLVRATARWKRDARSDETRVRIPLEHRGMFPCTSSPSACLIGSSKGAKLIGLVRAMVGCLACTVTHTGSLYRCCVPALSESHPNAGQREQTKKQVDEKDWSKKKFKFRSNDCNASGEAAVNGHWETLRRNSLVRSHLRTVRIETVSRYQALR